MSRASVVGNRIATGSAGVGFAFRLVTVTEVVPAQNTCTVTDVTNGDTIQVGLNKRGRDAWPQVGDRWVIDRASAGHWMLAIKVTDTQPPVATANLDTEPDLGALVKTLAALGLVADQTAHQGFGWQVPGVATGSSIGTGWALGPTAGSSLACRFRLHRNHLEVLGTMHSTSSSPSSVPLVLPHAFSPGSEQRSTSSSWVSSTASVRLLEVDTAGNVAVYPPVTTTSTDLHFNIWAPMEAITP